MKSVQEPILDYGPPKSVVQLNDGQSAFQWKMDNSGVIPVTTPGPATVYGSSGSASINTQSTSYIAYGDECIYTLLARESGNDWVITGFRKPRLACE